VAEASLPADRSRVHLNQALKIFSDKPHLQNELTRTKFKRGELLRLMGQEEEAQNAILEAYRLRKELVPEDDRSLEELKVNDFDKLVAYWSR
jgi:hypothetical protein